MGIIHDNPRQERFANLLARGIPQGKAYVEAGYKKSSKSAALLAQNEIIVKRVTELQQAAVRETTLDVKRIITEYERIGFANMLDYIKVDPADGSVRLDFTDLKRETAAAIGEIVIDEDVRNGVVVARHVKFKLLDKLGALTSLGKYLGMFVDRKLHEHKGIMFHVDANDASL